MNYTAIIITGIVCLTLFGVVWLACKYQNPNGTKEQDHGKD